MSSELFLSLKLAKQTSVYKYVLMNEIQYNDERNDDKKFVAWYKEIVKPSPNIRRVLYEMEDENDKFDMITLGTPFSVNDFDTLASIKKPSPLFTYKNVDVTIIPEAEKNKKVKDIRSSLINNPKELIAFKGKKYKVTVEKNDNTVNYYLYNPKEYYSYLADLQCPSFEICKQWNDEEYINLLIQLSEWKRKQENSETQKLVQYLSEVKGKFDVWYLEHKLETPNLVELIKQLRKNIVDYASSILSLKSEITSLKTDREELEKKFDNDLDDFPLDLSNNLANVEFHITEKETKVEKLRFALFGTLEGIDEGLVWKHDRLIEKYKKINIDAENKFEELLEKSTNRNVKELEEKIKLSLQKNNIVVDEIEINDLCLKVLHLRLSNEEQFYEEIVNPKKIEDNISSAIDKVLKNNFKIEDGNEIEKIQFATPRANRDERLKELEDDIWNFENAKRINKDDPAYVSKVNKWLSDLEKERSELAKHLIGDVYLGNQIKDLVRKEIEKLKNITGLTYLSEKEYNETITLLINDCSAKTFHFITNNAYDEIFEDEELNNIIHNQIKKLLPQIDDRFKLYTNNNNDVVKKEIVEEISPNFKEENHSSQRQQVIEYLTENYKDFISDYNLNMNRIAYEITDAFFPSITASKRRDKKEVIRQELIRIRKYKLL